MESGYGRYGSSPWTYQTSSEHTVQQNNPDIIAACTTSLAPATSFTFLPLGPAFARSAGPSRASNSRVQQPRYAESQWEQHQEELKSLYLVQKKTLPWIMEFMSREKSFTATQKQYKDRFSIWGWQKNLPVETAQFMVYKANERKRGPESKDTIYEFGGLTWTTQRAEMTIKRAKRHVSDITDMPTPNGVVYQTPINIDESSPETALTPHNGAEDIDIVMNNTSSPYPEDDWESDSDSERDQLPLMWNGHTRSDVHALFQQAGELARHRDPSRAESLFQDAVKGYQRLVGPMHEETSKVVFTLATFYFEQDHLAKAYSLLEKNGRIYLKNLGIHHRRTQQHVADIVQLLHGWGKEDDALAFLARASEPTLQTRPMYDTNRQQKPRNASDASRPKGASQDSTLAEAIKSINDNPQDPDQLNYGLSVIRTHGFVGGEGVRELLMITIKACGQDVDRLAVQRLKTWGELLRFHQRTSHDNIDVQMFKNAHIAFCDVLNRFPWNERKNKFKSFEVIEAALELVAPFVKATYLNDAKRMFQMCEDNSRARFGDEDERTIWMFISIGLVYQRYTTWTEAGPWFERALNAAMEKYNEDDGIRIALEEAMELKHFSYVNDEGRPFRTIFGVGGLKITPMRLHME